MMDEKDILWGMYQDHRNEGRHVESQRATMTNLILAISAGILGLVTFKELSRIYLPLTLFLSVIGLFGSIFSAKLYERFQFHMERARSYRNKLETLVPESNLTNLRKKANIEHQKYFSKKLIKLRLNRLWIILHLFIAFLGSILLLLSIL